jgi:hypothetical protein
MNKLIGIMFDDLFQPYVKNILISKSSDTVLKLIKNGQSQIVVFKKVYYSMSKSTNVSRSNLYLFTA